MSKFDIYFWIRCIFFKKILIWTDTNWSLNEKYRPVFLQLFKTYGCVTIVTGTNVTSENVSLIGQRGVPLRTHIHNLQIYPSSVLGTVLRVSKPIIYTLLSYFIILYHSSINYHFPPFYCFLQLPVREPPEVFPPTMGQDPLFKITCWMSGSHQVSGQPTTQE